MRLFVEFILSEILRSLRFLKMTRGEGLAITSRVIKRMLKKSRIFP
jgi:hypothetical protein